MHEVAVASARALAFFVLSAAKCEGKEQIGTAPHGNQSLESTPERVDGRRSTDASGLSAPSPHPPRPQT